MRKDHALVAAYGTLDELNACVGVLLESIRREHELAGCLEKVQRLLFVIGTEVSALAKPKQVFQKLTCNDVKTLEQQIDTFSAELPALRNFILPAGNQAAAFAHLCRTVCRRAERRLCRLVDDYEVRGELLAYLNRLSDWFFTVARLLVQRAGDKEKLV